MSSGYVVRCRHCRRIVLSGVPHIGDRETDALISHLKTCRIDFDPREEVRWRRELGSVLELFEVSNDS